MTGNPKRERPKRERLPRERLSDNNVPTEVRARQNANLVRSGLGRPLGSRNATPKYIQDTLLAAAKQYGADGKGTDELTGFWFYAIQVELRAVLGIFARMLPQHVQTSVDPQSALGKILEVARARLQYEKSRTITAQATPVTKLP